MAIKQLNDLSVDGDLTVSGGGTFQTPVTIDSDGSADNYYLNFSESGSSRFTIYENSNNIYFNGWAGHTIFRPQMGGSGSFAVYGGNTQFDTSGNATFAGTITGTTITGTSLDINGSANISGGLTLEGASDQMFILKSTDDGPIYHSYYRGTDRHAYVGFGGSGDVFHIVNEESAGSIQLGTASTTALTLDSSQNATFSGDIELAATKRIAFADSKIKIGSNDTPGAQGIQIGYAATASGAQAIAFGYDSNATGNQSIAMGYNSTASGTYSQAYGYNVSATGTGTVVFGTSGSHSDADTLVASGLDLKVTGTGTSTFAGAVTIDSNLDVGGYYALDGSAVITSDRHFYGKTFNDTDDTNYYLNPAGSTVSLNAAGMIQALGFSTDTNNKFYSWRALENTSSSSNQYHKIARITAGQSSRFIIELVGRSNSYSDTALPAFGKIVGQLNNDNNYDIVYYNASATDEVVDEVGQVDVSTTATDIYVRVGQFSELSATAHISDGSIAPTSATAANGSVSAPTNYVQATEYKLWNTGNDGSGSGLDADTLDGQHASAFSTATGVADNADVTPSWVPSSDPGYFKQGSYSAQYTGDMDSLTGLRIIRSTSGSNRAFAAHHNVITIPNTGVSQYGAQLAFETGTVSDGGIKFRNSTNGTFTSWYRLYHEGHLPTLAELGAQASGSYITGTGSLSAQDLTDIGNLSGTNTGDQTLPTDFVSAANGGTFAGSLNVHGNILLTGTATTSNQTRMIDFTGFDKEGTTDFSDAALKVAQINRERLNAFNVTFMQANWLAASIENSLDLVISNPPYIKPNDPHLRDLHHEPLIALTSENGSNSFFHIASKAIYSLKLGGKIIFEHGYSQASEVSNILKDFGFKNIVTCKDFQGLDRYTYANK